MRRDVFDGPQSHARARAREVDEVAGKGKDTLSSAICKHMRINNTPLIAEFYLVDRGLRHRLPGFSSLGRLVVLTQGLRRFRCQWSHCGSCPTGPDSRGAGSVRSELIPIGHVAY